jgi:methylmalonyl-CoA mutase
MGTGLARLRGSQTIEHFIYIIGVNTFEPSNDGGPAPARPNEVTRSSADEKDTQIWNLKHFQKAQQERAPVALAQLQSVARAGGNIFEELMETVKSASLGQITEALFEVGGRYRRSM